MFKQDLYERCDEPAKRAVMDYLTLHYEFTCNELRMVYWSETKGKEPDLRYFFPRSHRWEYHEVHWRLGHYKGAEWLYETVRWPCTWGRRYVLENFEPLWCWCPNRDFSYSVVMGSDLILNAPQYEVPTKRGPETFYHVPREKIKIVRFPINNYP